MNETMTDTPKVALSGDGCGSAVRNQRSLCKMAALRATLGPFRRTVAVYGRALRSVLKLTAAEMNN